MERGGHRDLAAFLPEDVLADVLRRLAAPRWLAVSRCVCKAWRAIVDGEGLLRTELPFGGIFIYFKELVFPEFFSPPPSPCRPAISGKLDFLPPASKVHSDNNSYCIKDHCNGLLLVRVCTYEPPTYSYVVNPATRRWDTLPWCPRNHDTDIIRRVRYHEYLAFDPMMSSHYLVFRIPYLRSPTSGLEPAYDPVEEASEWPPSLYKLDIFSSRTRRWEERSFVREGDAVGTVAKMRCPYYNQSLLSVYWRGSLYVHCQTNFVMRISLSEDKYTVIRPPTIIGARPYLGRSEKGVYIASFVEGHIRIFILNESCDQAEWMFKHDYDLKPVKAFVEQVQGPWILEDINYDLFHYSLGEIDKKEVVQEASEWISDNDDFDDNRDVGETSQDRDVHIDILGFHPYKEIMFLCSLSTNESNATGFAYHLNSFKVEGLGSMYPTVYDHFDESRLVDESWDMKCFPYTACCWIEEIPETEN